MASGAESRVLARVADVRFCEDAECPLPPQHLSVHLREVPLARGNATALSYAWGEFDRRKCVVGHASSGLSRFFSIELGSEWVLGDILSRLIELSANTPIWLDQFCIPQKEEEIIATLANMPSIYRTFDVVVLPRRELMYAQQVRCVWAAYRDSECVRVGDENMDACKLAPFMHQYYHALVNGGCLERWRCYG